MREGSGNRKPKSSGFSSPSGGRQGDGRRERPLRDSIDKGEDSLGLVERLGKLDELAGGLGVK